MTMDKTSKLLSIVDSKVTNTAEKTANNFSFLWGHQPKTPKSFKKALKK
jgi:hypothetical protein